jgi:hypothetical protein
LDSTVNPAALNNSLTTEEKDGKDGGRFSNSDPMGLLALRTQPQSGSNQIELRIPPNDASPIIRRCDLEDDQKRELKAALGVQAKFVPSKEVETAVDEDLEPEELPEGETEKFWRGKATFSLPFLIAESAYMMFIGYNQVKYTTFEQSQMAEPAYSATVTGLSLVTMLLGLFSLCRQPRFTVIMYAFIL